MALDHAAIAELRTTVQTLVDRIGLDSCQYALAAGGEIVASEAVGHAARQDRFLMFSSTKVLAAAVAWRLVGSGDLDLERPVASWWPALGQHGKAAITLEHLLVHAAGLPNAALSPEALEDRERRAAEIEAWTLEWAPGSRSEYHALSAHWILVELIARVTGSDHRAAIRELLLDPLDLPRLELGVPVERQGDIRPIVACGEPATVDELAEEVGRDLAELLAPLLGPVYEPDGPVVGPLTTPAAFAAGIPGAGGVSDAESVALLYQALLHDPDALWDPEVLHSATRVVHATDPGQVGNPTLRGLGVEIAGGGAANERRLRLGSGWTSPDAFGHGGAGGQIAWADPQSGLSFAFLTNGWDRNLARGRQRDRILNEAAARCAR
jgi:CubicO group peptidase (beta-lactamase class C family)